jgi:hypothetical protein
MFAAILGDETKLHVVLWRHRKKWRPTPPTARGETSDLHNCCSPQTWPHENSSNDPWSKEGCGLGHEHRVVAITRMRETISRAETGRVGVAFFAPGLAHQRVR